MFKHSDGWQLNARILRLATDFRDRTFDLRAQLNQNYLDRIVREEIAQDRGLVWC